MPTAQSADGGLLGTRFLIGTLSETGPHFAQPNAILSPDWPAGFPKAAEPAGVTGEQRQSCRKRSSHRPSRLALLSYKVGFQPTSTPLNCWNWGATWEVIQAATTRLPGKESKAERGRTICPRSTAQLRSGRAGTGAREPGSLVPLSLSALYRDVHPSSTCDNGDLKST